MNQQLTEAQTIDPRHIARALAVQSLFQKYISERHKLPVHDDFGTADMEDLYEGGEHDQKLYEMITSGVEANRAIIDTIIQKLAPLWPVDQISLIDLVILRIGIWESFMSNHVPAKVGIDEAIELAKEFSGEISAKFVNGVLGNLLKNDQLKDALRLRQQDNG